MKVTKKQDIEYNYCKYIKALDKHIVELYKVNADLVEALEEAESVLFLKKLNDEVTENGSDIKQELLDKIEQALKKAKAPN